MAYAYSGALVFHDRFQVKGGGERLALAFAKSLDAPIVTEYWDREGSYAPHTISSPILALGEKVKLRGMWFIAPALRFRSFSKRIKASGVILFSGSSCLAAARRQPGAVKVLYCYSPPRFAFDKCEFLAVRQHPLVRPFFRLFAAGVRGWYRRRLKDMDLVLCVSKTIQERLLQLCGQESEVLYPGISIPPSSPTRGDYFLSFARIDPLKRVEQIVEAFLEMPEQRLVVASTGSGEAALRKLAAGAPNIEIVGGLSDEELQKSIRHCVASIYIPIDEDFGLTPLEAAAVGKPTIGVAEGGLRETIVDGQTGILLPPAFGREDLKAAVRSMDPERAAAMREACLAQAEAFENRVFVRRLHELLKPKLGNQQPEAAHA